MSAAPDRSSGKGGHEMYVIAEGSVMIEKDGVQLGRLRKYDFFGELAVCPRPPGAVKRP